MNLVMETERKKRRLSYDEEDEDFKMERFFALIRSAKDIRDRLLDKEEPKPRDKKKATIAPKSTAPATAAKSARASKSTPATAAKSTPATASKSATKPATASKTPSFQPADSGVVAGFPKTDMMIINNEKEKQVEAFASTSRRSEERENEKGEDDERSDYRTRASRPVIDLNLSL